jgi:hypothetical protein
MPLQRIHFDISGDVQYSRAFDRYAHEARDLSEPFDDIADQILAMVGEQFGTEGARTGARWRPLSAAYAIWKDREFPGKPMLVREGDMREAALTKAKAVRITDQHLVYEIHDEKAIYHQRGSGHLPQRKLVDLTLLDRRGWDRTFASWLNSLRRGPLRHSRR